MTPERLIPLVMIPIVLALVLLRNRRPRPLNVNLMWITPLLVTLLIGFGLWGMSQGDATHRPFAPLDWLILAVGLGLGSAFGWQRGRMTTITRRADGGLEAQASPLGLILIVAILALRQALRPWMEVHAADWHVSPVAIQDAFLLFAAGMVVVQRVEMWLRARAISAGHPDAHTRTTTA